MKATYEEVSREQDVLSWMYIRDEITHTELRTRREAIYEKMGWTEDEHETEMERRIK